MVLLVYSRFALTAAFGVEAVSVAFFWALVAEPRGLETVTDGSLSSRGAADAFAFVSCGGLALAIILVDAVASRVSSRWGGGQSATSRPARTSTRDALAAPCHGHCLYVPRVALTHPLS